MGRFGGLNPLDGGLWQFVSVLSPNYSLFLRTYGKGSDEVRFRRMMVGWRVETRRFTLAYDMSQSTSH